MSFLDASLSKFQHISIFDDFSKRINFLVFNGLRKLLQFYEKYLFDGVICIYTLELLCCKCLPKYLTILVGVHFAC